MSTIEEHNILRYEPHSVVNERMGFVRSRTGFFIGDPSKLSLTENVKAVSLTSGPFTFFFIVIARIGRS